MSKKKKIESINNTSMNQESSISSNGIQVVNGNVVSVGFPANNNSDYSWYTKKLKNNADRAESMLRFYGQFNLKIANTAIEYRKALLSGRNDILNIVVPETSILKDESKRIEKFFSILGQVQGKGILGGLDLEKRLDEFPETQFISAIIEGYPVNRCKVIKENEKLLRSKKLLRNNRNESILVDMNPKLKKCKNVKEIKELINTVKSKDSPDKKEKPKTIANKAINDLMVSTQKKFQSLINRQSEFNIDVEGIAELKSSVTEVKDLSDRLLGILGNIENGNTE